MLKQFTYAVSILTAVASYAAPVKQAQFFEQGYPLDNQKYPAAYSAPARTDVRGGVDFFFSGSFIYQRPFENGLELGTLSTGIDPVIVSHQDMNFDFKPGFKVGAGVDLDQDDWVLDFEYTRLHTTNRASITDPEPSPFALNSSWFVQVAPTNTERLSARWKCDFDLIDANLGRPFYSGKNLTLRSTLGMRGGWINQSYRIRQSLIDGIVATARETQKSWLIGFRPGFGGNWNIGSIFRFVQDFHAGLYYQSFRLNYSQQDLTDPTVTYATSKVRKAPVVMGLESFSGIGLGGYLYNNRLHLDLLAGYRFQVMTDQNFLGAATAQTAAQENLSLQGAEVTLKLDF